MNELPTLPETHIYNCEILNSNLIKVFSLTILFLRVKLYISDGITKYFISRPHITKHLFISLTVQHHETMFKLIKANLM